jgi:hypothetical protein
MKPETLTRYLLRDFATGLYLQAEEGGVWHPTGIRRIASWPSEWTSQRREAVSYALHSEAFTGLLRRRALYPALEIVAYTPGTTRVRRDMAADIAEDFV